MPFTLRNIKEDLEDIGSRFDGAPDLEFLRGDQGARPREIRPELPAHPARLSLSVRPHAQEARGGVRVLRGSGRMKVDDDIVELKEWDAVRVLARCVARLRGRAGRGSRDPRHRRSQSRRASARRCRRPARLVGD